MCKTRVLKSVSRLFCDHLLNGFLKELTWDFRFLKRQFLVEVGETVKPNPMTSNTQATTPNSHQCQEWPPWTDNHSKPQIRFDGVPFGTSASEEVYPKIFF